MTGSLKVVMLLGRSTGGIGTHVAQLSAELRERGADVLVVTHPLTAEHFDLGPVRLCWPGSAGRVHTLRDLRTVRRLVTGADIVHAHGHQGGLLATLCTRRLPAPGRGGLPAPKLVVSQHNAVLQGSSGQLLKRLSQRWVARHADLVTGASSDLVDQALAFGARRAELAEVPSPRVPGLLAQRPADPADRLRLRESLLTSLSSDLPEPDVGDVAQLPGPGDLAELTQLAELADLPDLADLAGPAGPAGPAELADLAGSAGPESGRAAGMSAGPPLVLTISRIAPQKDLEVLVRAAALLRHTCRWVVLGDGEPELLAQLRAQASALAVSVHFVGACSEVDQWLRAAEVFVLPSRWEARALVVQEAMAAGTPVVATDVGGLHDLVGQTGLLVPPGDPESIATAIDSILADPGLRERLAARGRDNAAALPDGSEMATRWLAWYAQTRRMT